MASRLNVSAIIVSLTYVSQTTIAEQFNRAAAQLQLRLICLTEEKQPKNYGETCKALKPVWEDAIAEDRTMRCEQMILENGEALLDAAFEKFVMGLMPNDGVFLELKDCIVAFANIPCSDIFPFVSAKDQRAVALMLEELENLQLGVAVDTTLATGGKFLEDFVARSRLFYLVRSGWRSCRRKSQRDCSVEHDVRHD